MSAATADKFLGGKIIAKQPAAGFRSGLDAVMLAAAVPAREKSTVLEIGAGVGVASLCLAARVGCVILGIEIDADLVNLANENAHANKFGERVKFLEDDIFMLRPQLRRTFDHVFCNPPFHGDDEKASPNAHRARAMKDGRKLGEWLHAAMKRVSSRGTFTTIIRADRMRDAIADLPPRGVVVFPLWPKPVEQAKRVIIQARKTSRAQSVILPGLVLHDDRGKYTPEAEAVLRGGHALHLDHHR
ncbi:MAG: methyltransferase [Rhizomicrobium sp.]